MATFVVPNNMVALEPFPATAQKVEVKNGVIAPLDHSLLSRLKIVFMPTEAMESWPEEYDYTHAWVASKLQTVSTYARNVYDVNGTKFILVPISEVLLWEHEGAEARFRAGPVTAGIEFVKDGRRFRFEKDEKWDTLRIVPLDAEGQIGGHLSKGYTPEMLVAEYGAMAAKQLNEFPSPNWDPNAGGKVAPKNGRISDNELAKLLVEVEDEIARLRMSEFKVASVKKPSSWFRRLMFWRK